MDGDEGKGNSQKHKVVDSVKDATAISEKSNQTFENAKDTAITEKPTEPAAAARKTTPKQIKATLAMLAAAALENTEKRTNSLATPTKSAAIADNSSNLDPQKIKHFLAEVESAPKHLIQYGSHDKLTKLISAYTEQGTQAATTYEIQTQLKSSKFSSEPGCSYEATTSCTAAESQTQQTAEKDKLTTKLNQSSKEHVDSFKLAVKVLPQQKDAAIIGPAAVIKSTAVAVGSTMSATEFGDLSSQTEMRIPMENADVQATPASSVRSINSLVCRICHNSENPERLVSPCLCKGSLSYVHIHCLERWISTSRSTICELCQFQYNTEQTLRYTCMQSLRMWYSRSMSRRALQEDCQMFSLLTLVAFGIIGTLLVGIQYYFIQGRHWGLSSMWTKGWLLFFLFTTLLVYFINIYMIIRSQLAPWYRWWQSARDIKLILENRKPFKILPGRRLQRNLEQQPPQAVLPGSLPHASPAIVPPSLSPPLLMPPAAPAALPSAVTVAISKTPPPPMHNQVAIAADGMLQNATTAATAAAATVAAAAKNAANKSQISSELTTAATEIIEIPPEGIRDSCGFERVETVV